MISYTLLDFQFAVDDASSPWLGAWVVRMGSVVAYLFLCLVEDIGGQLSKLSPLSKSSQMSNLFLGLPLEFSTDWLRNDPALLMPLGLFYHSNVILTT